LGKRKEITAACLLLLDGEKRRPKIMWVACSSDHGREKAAGCGRGAKEENSWLLQLA
jgi:hypothetical protein